MDGASDLAPDASATGGPHSGPLNGPHSRLEKPLWLQSTRFQGTPVPCAPVWHPREEHKRTAACERTGRVGRDPGGPLEVDMDAVVPRNCTAGMGMLRHHRTAPTKDSLGHRHAERGHRRGPVCGILGETHAGARGRQGCNVVLHGACTVPQVDGASDPAEAWEKLAPPSSGLTHVAGRFTAGHSAHSPSEIHPKASAGGPWASASRRGAGEVDREAEPEEDEVAWGAVPWGAAHGTGERHEESPRSGTLVSREADGRPPSFSRWEREGLPALVHGLRHSLATAEGGRGVPDSVPDPHVRHPTFLPHAPMAGLGWLLGFCEVQRLGFCTEWRLGFCELQRLGFCSEFLPAFCTE